ncbi:hypothetical protein [Brevundimonas sp.]|uniref:hypothetical protein n=1 Tax=Brevundimonas sp. TaxID=1871086 RepID=UPI0025CDB376|nr:hypothetical protein [Brevundimonas sp.]
MRQALLRPRLRLHGTIEDDWIDRLIEVIEAGAEDDILSIEVMTTGGDAEVGRRLSLEICMARDRGRRVAFLGKTTVYSAGATFMGCFRTEERWLTPDCWLLIHERQMQADIPLNGGLRACRAQLQKAMAEVETGEVLQRKGFEDLAAGSKLSADEVERRALENWYLKADEALELGLVGGIFEG